MAGLAYLGDPAKGGAYAHHGAHGQAEKAYTLAEYVFGKCAGLQLKGYLFLQLCNALRTQHAYLTVPFPGMGIIDYAEIGLKLNTVHRVLLGALALADAYGFYDGSLNAAVRGHFHTKHVQAVADGVYYGKQVFLCGLFAAGKVYYEAAAPYACR